MKKTIMNALVAIFIAVSARASETNSGWEPSLSLRSVVANKYLAFGSGAVLFDKPVVQTDLFLSFKNGFYADLWNSASLTTGWDKDFGSEVDYGVGWAGPLSTFGCKGTLEDVTLDLGVTYFDEPGVFDLGAVDVLYSHVKLLKPLKRFSVFVSWENYTPMPNSGFEGGNLYNLGVCKSRDIPKTPLTLSGNVALTYDDGGFGFDQGLLLKGYVELDILLTKKLSLIVPQVNWYVPLTVHDARVTDAVVFAGVRYQF